MSNKNRTPKQQAATYRKFIYVIGLLGFKLTYHPVTGNYWRKQVNAKTKEHLCIGHGVPDQCLINHKTHWVFQKAEEGKEPLFGYSGTTHIGDEGGTFERLLEIVFDKYRSEGSYDSTRYHQERLLKVQDKLKIAAEEIESLLPLKLK